MSIRLNLLSALLFVRPKTVQVEFGIPFCVIF
jgi:hypothetical protein